MGQMALIQRQIIFKGSFILIFKYSNIPAYYCKRVQCRSVQYSSVEYSSVEYNSTQYSSVQYNNSVKYNIKYKKSYVVSSSEKPVTPADTGVPPN